MPEDIKPHQLYKQLDGVTLDTVFDGSTYLSQTVSAGWENLPVTIYPDGATSVMGGACYRTYIDLTLFQKEELTTFFQGFDIQKSNIPTGTASIVFEYDFITSRKLTLQELGTFDWTPGFLPSTVDLMQLVYGQMRTYAVNTVVPGTYITTATESYGSGNATAMTRLHWTRVYIIADVASRTITTFPTNLIVQCATVKEDDLIWIERLRRSYVHHDRADI